MELFVVESSETLTHIALSGSLNLAGVQKIEIVFLAHTAAAKKPTIVDLAAVDFLASLGLRMLLDAAKTLRRNERPFILLRPTFDVEAVLKMSGIDTIAIILHSEEDARARAFS